MSVARARPRKRDEEVVTAAARVFSERGYDGTSVRDVADALGLSKGSLYYYTRTKEDLLFRVVESVHGENERILADVRAEPGLEPLERLARYVRRQVVFNLSNPERMSVYHSDRHRLDDERRAAIERRRRDHADFVADLIAAAQAGGAVDPALDPRLAANLVFGTIGRHFGWFRDDGAAGIEAVADLCVRYAIGGLSGPAV